MITIFSNARVVAASFARTGATAGARASSVVRHHGRLLQTRVRARASGRPGPNAPTGNYRRSIGFQIQTPGGGTVIGQVGTNMPQGRRLEMGFTGTDSLGRYYDQQPYPHFGPALDETQSGFLEDLSDAVVDTL